MKGSQFASIKLKSRCHLGTNFGIFSKMNINNQAIPGVGLIGWHLNSKVGSEEAAAVFEAVLQVDQVPALLQLVANHKNLIPCLPFFVAAAQDLVVDQERKEFVLDDVSLPHCKEDLFDGKQKHRCRDQKVGEVEDNPVNLE